MQSSKRLTLLLFAGFFFFCLRPIQDHDVWWHLATGRYIAAAHHLPTRDMFSWTCAGHPWINNYWLYDVALFALYSVGGLSGIIFYKGLLSILIFLPVYKRLKLRKTPGVWSLLGTWACFMGSRLSSQGWGERASLISLLGVSWLFWHLETVRFGQRPKKSLWIWPVIFVLWANMHPGFLLGVMVAVCYGIGEWIDTSNRQKNWPLWMAACGLAACVTPYGLDTFRMLLRGVSHTQVIKEWQSTPWTHFELYWVFLTGYWGRVVFAWKTHQGSIVPLGFLGMAFALSLLSIQHVLYVPFFVVLAAPWVVGWMKDVRSAAKIRQRLSVGSQWAVLILVVVFVGYSAAEIRGGVDTRQFPVDACRYIDRQQIPGPFYNNYSFGGYWMWHFWGRRQVFIDGRYPTVDGYVELWDDILKAQHGTPKEWEAFLNHWNVQGALLPPANSTNPPAAYEAYFPAARWTLAYQDSAAVVYVRKKSE